jgi:DNA-binding transcriptional MocR family regulator
MVDALARHFPPQAEWTRPAGGLFVWITLPAGTDGNDLFVAARRRGVLYSRGELFHSEGSGRNQLRLTYSAASLPEIESGVATLGALIRERWPDRSEPERPGAAEAMPIF